MKCKKGIIFALDGAIAISVVLIMLINTTYYFTTTSQESLSQSQVIKRGYDVIALFGEAERLDYALRSIENDAVFVDDEDDYATDGAELIASHYLPPGYDMSIELYDAVKTECFSTCTIPNGPPSDRKKYTGPITQEELVNGGDVYVQVNATLVNDISGNPVLSVVFNPNFYPMTSICAEGETCIYTTTVPILDFPIGESSTQIRVNTDNDDEFDVHWIRILDDPAYMLSSERTIPRGQFIGSGERWYAAFDDNGHFEGMHKVGFKVWIEGGSVE